MVNNHGLLCGPNFSFGKGELQVSTDGHTEVCLISRRAVVSYLCIAFLLPAVCSSIPLCVPNVIFPPESQCVLLNPMLELPVGSIITRRSSQIYFSLIPAIVVEFSVEALSHKVEPQVLG